MTREILIASAAAGGMLAGGLLAWLIARARLSATEARLAAESARADDLGVRLAEADMTITRTRTELTGATQAAAAWQARCDQEKLAAAEKQTLLVSAENRFRDAFKALSSEALLASQEQFLQLARSTWETHQAEVKAEMDNRQTGIEGMLKPVSAALDKFHSRVGELEVAREGAYAGLREQLQAMNAAQGGLREETARLVRALRQPTGRGQWGEMQLQRVAELAGMREHCDFHLQTSTTGEDGDRLRPDMLVHLPGGRHVVVDAKSPMEAYLEALDAPDDARRADALVRHARQVRQHISQLAAKDYPSRHTPGPEFVVMFLPSEAIFAAALAQDPGLIEKGVAQGVILATPTTLIALLRVISQGWREETLAANAREISDLGRRIHERLGVMNAHLGKLGRSLTAAVDAYNRTVGSFETRVLVDARRFEDLGAANPSTSLVSPEAIEISPRPPADDGGQMDALR